MTPNKRLPDAEFEIMEAVWQLECPVTANRIMEVMENQSKSVRKLQTIHTLLSRLVDHGALKSEKRGKERFFTPLFGREEYLQFETQAFMNQYYNGSCLNLIHTLYQGKELRDDEIAELVKWADEWRKEK